MDVEKVSCSLALTLLFACAPLRAGIVELVPPGSRAQPGEVPQRQIELRYSSAQGNNIQNFRVRYAFDGSRIRISPDDIIPMSPFMTCTVEGDSIVVETMGPGGALQDQPICRLPAFLLLGPFHPSRIFIPGSQESCTGGSCPLSRIDDLEIEVLKPRITTNPASNSTVNLFGTLGGAEPMARVDVFNDGDDFTLLNVFAQLSGSGLVLGPPTDAMVPRGGIEDFVVRCPTTQGGSFQADLLLTHNDIPDRPSPLTFRITCQVAAPPTLVFQPPENTAQVIVIPGTPGATPLQQIDITTLGGAGGGTRSLSCANVTGYTIAVETSPFPAGATGRIRLGCSSGQMPPQAALVCNDSPGTGTKTWQIRCDANPAFTAAPAFDAPVVLDALVGDPAPQASFVASNTGTPGTVLTFGAPSGLSGALSVAPPEGASMTAGAVGVSYTITCNTVASFSATQTLTFVHNGSGSPATLPVTCNIRTPPTLVYAPLAGLQIPVAASVDGATRTATIEVTTTGGDAGGTRALACTPPPGFTVTVQNSPVSTGAQGFIRIGCNTLSPAPGNLSCTETPGGNVRLWPLLCQNLPVYTSSPRPSSAVAAYGAINEVFANTTIQVSNSGTAVLNVSNCATTPSGVFGITSPGTVPPLSSGRFTVDCVPPAAGSALAANLTCDTTDPTRSTVLYRLFCVAPPATDVGEGASPIDRLTSPSPDRNALLGSATSIGVGPAGEEILVAGAPNAGDDGDGRVYVFVRPAGSQGTAVAAKGGREVLGAPARVLAAPARDKRAKGIGNKFGQAVAVSPNGQRIAVGAPIGGGSNTGQVLVFTRPAGGWDSTELETLVPVMVNPPTASGAVAGDFGAELAYGDDGTLVVGAPGTIVSTLEDAGAVYRFDQALAPVGSPVTSETPSTGAQFGTAVDVGGGMLAIGAPGESGNTGAIYVYDATEPALGPVNHQTAASGSIGDKFGAAIAIGGGAIVVGAPNDDTAAGADSGSATVLLQGTGNGVQFAATLTPDAGTAQGAGAAVATNGDVVVLGAPLTTVGDDVRRGRTLVFDLDAAAIGFGRPAGTYENAIGGEGDDFGNALAISSTRLLIGAPLSDEGTDLDEGRVDPFVLDRIFRGGFDR
ncbi:MAG TPA: hypothetical protein VND91_04450 [Candidatus Saccharimonadia bacterium]|nr:hypothetical protein [Candidatus Saccharimonadia bacterium]